MAQRLANSLREEYRQYIEQEIEAYKESVPRSVLLSIGDEAVASLGAQAQLALTELLLCQEVDRIIFRRLRLPAYETWRRRRLKILAELRRPEHWGLRPDDVVVRAVRPVAEGHVLMAGAFEEASALYLAANGCEVTAVSFDVEPVERVLQAAYEAGLAERVHGCVTDLAAWAPERDLTAVIVTPAALEGLSAAERSRVLTILQSATADGGVHLVRAIAQGPKGITLEELRSSYEGWTVSVDHAATPNTFLARKEVS